MIVKFKEEKTPYCICPYPGHMKFTKSGNIVSKINYAMSSSILSFIIPILDHGRRESESRTTHTYIRFSKFIQRNLLFLKGYSTIEYLS